MTIYRIAPEHLDEGVFSKLVGWMRDTRVHAKHSEEEFIDGILKDTLAQTLKIVINAIYGKFSYEYGSTFDKLATLKVTINGQLFLLMLCEELELNDIHVISANTDGIVVKVHKTKKETYDNIIKWWEEYTGLELDTEEYNRYVARDINNFCLEEINGKFTAKGDLNPKMYAVDLSKGYNQPIVAQAVVNYFLKNKPIFETLYEARNILDFCKTQNIGRKYTAIFNDKKIQNNTRFYVSTNGGYIFKEDNLGKRNNLCSGYRVTIINTLDDKPIEQRNINYQYYYDEAMKIIDPIKLNISPNQKADARRRIKSGKALLKKYSGDYGNLFEDNE